MAGRGRTSEEVLRAQDNLSKEHSKTVHKNPWNFGWHWVSRDQRTKLEAANREAGRVLKKEQGRGRFTSVPGGHAKERTLEELEQAELADQKLREESGEIVGY